MKLKAIDLGLMSEHLDIHKGVIQKLESYFCSTKESVLRQLIYDQILIMSNHVGVMIQLIDPTQNEEVTVSALNKFDPVDISCNQKTLPLSDRTISYEGSHIAKTMSLNNFDSALMMKTRNVKEIHLRMALQQFTIQGRYHQYIKEKGWAHEPDATVEEQKKTVKIFKDFYNL